MIEYTPAWGPSAPRPKREAPDPDLVGPDPRPPIVPYVSPAIASPSSGAPVAAGGPGTELAAILHALESLARPLAIAARPFSAALASALTLPSPCSCGCGAYAAWMDRLGVSGCRREAQTIAEHLVEQAGRQGLSCPSWVARGLVLVAIARTNRIERQVQRDAVQSR